MAGTSEGGKKAAAHQSMSEKGRKGGKAADHKKGAGHQNMSEKGHKGGKR